MDLDLLARCAINTAPPAFSVSTASRFVSVTSTIPRAAMRLRESVSASQTGKVPYTAVYGVYLLQLIINTNYA